MSESEEDIKAIQKMELIEKQVMSLLPILKGHMTDEFQEYLTSLITHCECGIAFEDIIDTIIYLKISLSKKDYEKIVTAGGMMNFTPKSWEPLEDFVKD